MDEVIDSIDIFIVKCLSLSSSLLISMIFVFISFSVKQKEFTLLERDLSSLVSKEDSTGSELNEL
jgi:hypothetical protein